MSVCLVKQSGLCQTCCNHGIPGPEPDQRVLEINDLCYPCIRGMKGSYIGAVNAKRKEILRSVMQISPWYKEHGMPEWMSE